MGNKWGSGEVKFGGKFCEHICCVTHFRFWGGATLLPESTVFRSGLNPLNPDWFTWVSATTWQCKIAVGTLGIWCRRTVRWIPPDYAPCVVSISLWVNGS